MIQVYPEDEYRAFVKEAGEPRYIRCPMCGRVLLDLRSVKGEMSAVCRCRSCKKLIRIIAE